MDPLVAKHQGRIIKPSERTVGLLIGVDEGVVCTFPYFHIRPGMNIQMKMIPRIGVVRYNSRRSVREPEYKLTSRWLADQQRGLS